MDRNNGTFGAAEWATAEQLERAGMFNPGGVQLGQKFGRYIYHHGDGHIFTLAQPGSGKSAALVVPNLLQYQGSVIVTDPKGSVTAQTYRYRSKELGQRVVVLNPWASEMARPAPDGIGINLGDTGFNPLYKLKDDISLGDNALQIAKVLIPPPKERIGSNDDYFVKAPRDILTGMMMLMVRDPEFEVTLPQLATLVRETKDGFGELATKMMACGLGTYASEINSAMESDRQWRGVVGGLHTATSLYRPGTQLAAHVSKNEFNPSILKTEDVTVYFLIPSERRDDNKEWMQLVLNLMAEAIGRPGPTRPVLMVFEEFANLGYMPSIFRMMGEFREAGLKVWIVTLGIAGLTEIYGETGARKILELSETKQFFSTGEFEIANEISRLVGTRTVMSHSSSWSDQGGSNSSSETGVPLIRPDEIVNMPRHEQIILRLGPVPPIRAWLRGYYQDQELLDRSDPNPFRPINDRVAQPFEDDAVPKASGGAAMTALFLSVVPAAGGLITVVTLWLLAKLFAGENFTYAVAGSGLVCILLSVYICPNLKAFMGMSLLLPLQVFFVHVLYGFPNFYGPLPSYVGKLLASGAGLPIMCLVAWKLSDAYHDRR